MFFWLGLIAVAAVLALALWRSRASASAKVELPKVPNLVVEDDLDITLVTASPSKSAKPPSSKPRISGIVRGSRGGSAAVRVAEIIAPAVVPSLALNRREWDDDEDNEISPNPTVEVIYEQDAEVEEVTSPFARILLTAHGDSDVGKRRQDNQDSFLMFNERSVFAVADGMGGYEGGQMASRMTVEMLRRSFEGDRFEGHIESESEVPRRGRELACAIQMANQAVLQKARSNVKLQKMGTTILAARFSPNKQRVYVGHVGDSRCYRLRGGKLSQLTTDHTMAALGMKGPRAKDLSRAVGIGQKVTIDLIVDKPQNQDVYLLCSDGLPKMVTDERMQEILLKEPDLQAAVYALIEAANDAGGRDNVTAIVIKVVDRVARTN